MKRLYVAKSSERPNGVAWTSKEKAQESVKYFEKIEHTNIRIEEMSSFKFALGRAIYQVGIFSILKEVFKNMIEVIKLVRGGIQLLMIICFYPLVILYITYLEMKEIENNNEERA